MSPIETFHHFFFFNDTATTEIYTLSLHDALPICRRRPPWPARIRSAPGDDRPACFGKATSSPVPRHAGRSSRSEEHTSELQSRSDLVCRLLLEKKTRPAIRQVGLDWLRSCSSRPK